MSEKPIATQERSTQEQLQAELIDGFSKDDDEFEEWKTHFIETRLATLETDSRTQEFDVFTGSTDQFFSPTAEVKPLFSGRGFLMDDDSIYHGLIDTLREFYLGNEQFRDLAGFRQLSIYGVQFGLQRYFGNTKPSVGDQASREERLWKSGVLSSDDSPASDARSIAENKSEAMCAERAAVSHNMLKFLGWGSTYYTGKLSIDETDADLHAFVIYKKPNGEQNIYDSMNPEIIVNPEGKVVSVKPSIYPGGNEILSGNPVVARHPKYELKDGEYTETSSQVYRYFNNPLIAMRA